MKKEIELFGTLCMYAFCVVMIVLFYSAYANESKSITLFIDNFKEANSEAFFLVPLVIVVGTYSLVSQCVNYCKENKK